MLINKLPFQCQDLVTNLTVKPIARVTCTGFNLRPQILHVIKKETTMKTEIIGNYNNNKYIKKEILLPSKRAYIHPIPLPSFP